MTNIFPFQEKAEHYDRLGQLAAGKKDLDTAARHFKDALDLEFSWQRFAQLSLVYHDNQASKQVKSLWQDQLGSKEAFLAQPDLYPLFLEIKDSLMDWPDQLALLRQMDGQAPSLQKAIQEHKSRLEHRLALQHACLLASQDGDYSPWIQQINQLDWKSLVQEVGLFFTWPQVYQPGLQEGICQLLASSQSSPIYKGLLMTYLHETQQPKSETIQVEFFKEWIFWQVETSLHPLKTAFYQGFETALESYSQVNNPHWEDFLRQQGKLWTLALYPGLAQHNFSGQDCLNFILNRLEDSSQRPIHPNHELYYDLAWPAIQDLA